MRDWLEPSKVLWPNNKTGPWVVTLNWREDEGSTVCTGLSLALVPERKAQPVTASLVRKLPVAGIIAAARAERFAAEGGQLAEAYADGQDLDVTAHFIARLAANAEPWAERGPRRSTNLGPSRWREVAHVYSTALLAGQPPLVAVEATWHVSRPTASRWVKAARDAHLLPPTDRGRARGNGTLGDPKRVTR